jgi:hypothetical protein
MKVLISKIIDFFVIGIPIFQLYNVVQEQYQIKWTLVDSKKSMGFESQSEELLTVTVSQHNQSQHNYLIENPVPTYNPKTYLFS